MISVEFSFWEDSNDQLSHSHVCTYVHTHTHTHIHTHTRNHSSMLSGPDF